MPLALLIPSFTISMTGNGAPSVDAQYDRHKMSKHILISGILLSSASIKIEVGILSSGQVNYQFEFLDYPLKNLQIILDHDC